MQMFELSAIAALIALAVFVFVYTGRNSAAVKSAWMFPAILSAAFLVFSLITLANEGFGSLWLNHTSNYWGNQVWFDLLIGFGISWVFLVTEGRRLGMNAWPWIIALAATGNIGLLAMLARILYLKEHRTIAGT